MKFQVVRITRKDNKLYPTYFNSYDEAFKFGKGHFHIFLVVEVL